jgi:hypothetical protein
MAYVVKGGVGLCFGYALYVLFLAAPAPEQRGGVFWQKYLPMVNICRIMCIMEAIMHTVNL